MVEARTEGELAELGALRLRAAARAGRRLQRRDRRRRASPARSCACSRAAWSATASGSRCRRASRGTSSSPTASRAGLQGFECLSGIPGSTGATPIQNVGAYGQEVAETVESVRVLDRASGQIVELPAERVRLRATARSIFKYRDRHVVLAVTFRLREAARLRPAALRGAGARARRAGRRQRAARRRARGGARPAPRQGHGDRPRRPRLGQRRLVLHQPDPRARATSRALQARAGPTPAPARVPGARRADQDLGGVADRARRLPARLRRRARRDLDQAHARARQPRRRDAPPS